jgi:predicted GNAT superfamily acetyltransferase
MEPDIRLRTAEAADYDRIIAVVDDWWGRSVRHALPRLFLDHFHATSFVAERDGDLAGFLIGFLSPSLLDAAYIHFVGVNPLLRGSAYPGGAIPPRPPCAWRGYPPLHTSPAPLAHRQGLGRMLYERFFELAAANGRSVVRAVTAPQNTGSIAFHTAMGFTVTGPAPDYDGPASAKMVFERRLAN